MTSTGIFKEYFQKKLIIWGSICGVAMLMRIISGHETSFVLAVTVILSFFIVASIIGYIDYNFYEKSMPKIVAQLIGEPPIAGFQDIGFSMQEDNKLVGQVNNYKIILSPLTNLEGEKWLLILIPLKIREGLDNYFTKYDDAFRFRLSDEIIFAEAILKDYKKKYDYNKLLGLIDTTTTSLRENKIEPLTLLGSKV